MMSLDWSAIWDSVKANKGKLAIAGLAIVLVFVALYTWQCGGNYLLRSKQQKIQTNINTGLANISNINSQIANLEQQKAQVNGQIDEQTKELANATYGRDEAKTAANQALANYQKAVNTNSNIDRTAEDLKNKLKELDNE